MFHNIDFVHECLSSILYLYLYLYLHLDKLELYSLIQCGSGHFEICLENQVIVSGKIFRPDFIDMTPIKPKMKYPDTVSDVPHNSISKYDLYSLLEHNGYELGEQFKTVTNIDLHFEGKVICIQNMT